MTATTANKTATPITQAFKKEYCDALSCLEPLLTSKDTPRLPRNSYLGISRTKDKPITLEYALEIMVHKVGHLMMLKNLLEAKKADGLHPDYKQELRRMEKQQWFCSLKNDVTQDTFEHFRKFHYSHIVDVSGMDPALEMDPALPTLEQVRDGILALKDFFKPEELHANEVAMFDHAQALIDKHIALAQVAPQAPEDSIIKAGGIGHEGKIAPQLQATSEKIAL